jgi:hypothetical protein
MSVSFHLCSITWKNEKKNLPVHVGFVVDKVTLGQVSPLSTSVFPCQFHFTCAALLGKTKKKLIIFIFITGLHNKP